MYIYVCLVHHMAISQQARCSTLNTMSHALSSRGQWGFVGSMMRIICVGPQFWGLQAASRTDIRFGLCADSVAAPGRFQGWQAEYDDCDCGGRGGSRSHTVSPRCTLRLAQHPARVHPVQGQSPCSQFQDPADDAAEQPRRAGYDVQNPRVRPLHNLTQ